MTCFLVKISWNYFLLNTRWEWISMVNLQEKENEFSLLKSLPVFITTHHRVIQRWKSSITMASVYYWSLILLFYKLKFIIDLSTSQILAVKRNNNRESKKLWQRLQQEHHTFASFTMEPFSFASFVHFPVTVVLIL